MKPKLTAFVLALALALTGISAVFAQQGPERGRVEAARDQEMETAAKHNLEVARWYVTRRKAYQGARDRLQEILQTYPEFSRIDEVIYLLGQVDLKLGKGEEATKLYEKLVKNYPDSEFAKKAQEHLDHIRDSSGSQEKNAPKGAW